MAGFDARLISTRKNVSETLSNKLVFVFFIVFCTDP